MGTYKITFESTNTKTGYVVADSVQDAVNKLTYPCTRDAEGAITGTWNPGDGPTWDADIDSTIVGTCKEIIDLEHPDGSVVVPDAVAPEDW